MFKKKEMGTRVKRESVVVAILPSCMEVSYCTSGFFVAKTCQITLLCVSYAFPA